MSERHVLLAVHTLTARNPLNGGSVAAEAAAEALHAARRLGERAQTVAELHGERLGLGQPLLLERRQPVLTQAFLGERRKLVGQRLGRVQCLPGGNEALDEPAALR